MRTLPHDYHRCHATQPDSKCRQCLRWADLPDQTWGPRTPQISCPNSTDESCTYIQITKDEQ